jgi:hypothetical protein
MLEPGSVGTVMFWRCIDFEMSEPLTSLRSLVDDSLPSDSLPRTLSIAVRIAHQQREDCAYGLYQLSSNKTLVLSSDICREGGLLLLSAPQRSAPHRPHLRVMSTQPAQVSRDPKTRVTPELLEPVSRYESLYDKSQRIM